MRELSRPKKPDPNAGKYQPTAREQAVLDKYKAQTAAENTPRIKVSQKKGTAISVDHPDGLVGYALLTEALGTVDGDFVIGLLTSTGQCDFARSTAQRDCNQFPAVRHQRRQAERSVRGHVGGTDGRHSHSHHDVYATASQRRDYRAAG